MRERDWSKVQLFEAIGADLGYKPKSRSALYPLLHKTEPDEAKAAVLRRHFGDPPAEAEATSLEPEPSLAAALMALAKELAASREAREALEDRVAGLEATVRLLTPQSDPAPVERAALRG